MKGRRKDVEEENVNCRRKGDGEKERRRLKDGWVCVLGGNGR